MQLRLKRDYDISFATSSQCKSLIPLCLFSFPFDLIVFRKRFGGGWGEKGRDMRGMKLKKQTGNPSPLGSRSSLKMGFFGLYGLELSMLLGLGSSQNLSLNGLGG